MIKIQLKDKVVSFGENYRWCAEENGQLTILAPNGFSIAVFKEWVYVSNGCEEINGSKNKSY